MDKLPWPQILEVMYRGTLFREFERIQSEDDYIRLLQRTTDVNPGLIIETVDYMERTGLLEREEERMDGMLGPFRLTKKGFQVAHDRELRQKRINREEAWNRRQTETSRAVAFLTCGLIFVGVFQSMIIALVNYQNPTVVINGSLLVGFLLVAVLGGWLWNGGYFDEQL